MKSLIKELSEKVMKGLNQDEPESIRNLRVKTILYGITLTMCEKEVITSSQLHEATEEINNLYNQ
jgi:hypothetical protein